MWIEDEYALTLFFPNPTFTQIYFEAVANAFDADATEVTIKISSDAQSPQRHLEITITDNGQGFTDDRFSRFAELKRPEDKYHKGLGRLVFLNYFSEVNIVSVYQGAKRTFIFSQGWDGQSVKKRASPSDVRGTVLRFCGFLGDRLRTNNDIQPTILKERILEHFLPFFFERKKANKAFKVVIQLETVGSSTQERLYPESLSITVSDVPELEVKVLHEGAVHAFKDISMSYALREEGKSTILIAASVDGRTIPMPQLIPPNAIPVTWSAIFLFESELFAGKSDSSRQRLMTAEGVAETDLYRLLRRAVSGVLNEKLPEIEQRNTATRRRFEERYPHLTGYFEEETVGIINKDEAIELAQRQFFQEQKEVLESDSLDDAVFEKSLDVSSRTLTAYILYRELIIKKLRAITEKDREESIHELIVPRYREFHRDGLIDGIYNNNAWLLDDRFMSFRTILSEGSMQKLISAITLSEDAVEEGGRPDISMIFSADPNGDEMVDVVVIEIKKRKADEKENTYVQVQLVNRAQLLANYCPNVQRVWYFGVIHIDGKLEQLLKTMKWTPLFSKGQVFYQDFPLTRKDGTVVPTPIYLLSYDAVIEDAAARNHTFLEILKKDIKRLNAHRSTERNR